MFLNKYHPTLGTHCWFCDREYKLQQAINGFHQLKIIYIGRTREHLIPLNRIVYNIPNNYISSCNKCNSLKGNRDCREFAIYLDELYYNYTRKGELYKKDEIAIKYKLMIDRAWKAYNKTSYLHNNYLKLMRQSIDQYKTKPFI